LRTGVIREFEKGDLFTKNTHVRYDPEATLAEWDSFLKVSTQGDVDMMEYLQRAAGYTLTGLTTEECFFVLTGPTASGKSTFLDAMLTCMGLYSTTTQSDTFMYRRNRDTARDEMATLAGMRLVGMSEIPEGAVFNVPLINQATGGDRIKAKELYKNPFEFKPQFKLWIATNHDPAAQDAALMRRIKRIPFNHTIPLYERDPRLKTLLKDPEIGGRAVLAWAIRGAVKWYASGMNEPSSVKLAVEEYRIENDAFGRFLSECVVIENGAEISGRVLYQAFDMWARQSNEFAMRRPQFNQKLKERGFQRTATDIFFGIRPKKMTFSDNGVEWL
jgi:putative DNA primase/helicase